MISCKKTSKKRRRILSGQSGEGQVEQIEKVCGGLAKQKRSVVKRGAAAQRLLLGRSGVEALGRRKKTCGSAN